mmetsp:Transcript_7555/g.14809  ORF Transcript_7555/g.14809 Transcript_7555/m.14809 type:complete len:418 (+) Transcript_7555:469-1722(+)|eukprot:CAMPEP_0173400730 /NCGR_PEP_ID=MMETSP1356-20130122/48743_1 /TAXON_ID=77927 ORGANISM="Hemiselmis virescens, Strain PCC157" /NCGR_SAMPLE_ID=MMETSP1356 /ASSEMBLY_ACC=CAM_ASM_000847 /LENGTH=417 /DNA_ID=CAMNT_0014360707 /DNA_START=185 /DNA_END=1438 /DNA_ORIENTATION=-
MEIEAAKGQVEEAEKKVEVAKGEVEAAEKKVEAAKGEVEATEKKVEKAKGEVEAASTDGDKAIANRALMRAEKELDLTLEGVKWAQEGVKSAQKLLSAARDILIASNRRAQDALGAGAPQGGKLGTNRGQHFRVTARIESAKKMQGIRAAAYMRAEEHLARYDGTKEQSFRYDDNNNLHISVLFVDENSAGQFQSSLLHWHLKNPLVGLEGKVFVTEEIEMVESAKAGRVFLNHYVASDEESPMSSLSEFKTAVSSCPTVDIGSDSELVHFQCLEKPEYFASVNAYQLHIKDKAKFRDLRNNPNNLLAGSWTPFHQHFDGLNTPGNLPQVAVRFEQVVGEEIVGDERTKRHRVEVALEFRDSASERIMAPRLKNGSTKISECEWRTFVHVLDATEFKDCLEWKHADTKRKWMDFDGM